MSYGRYQLDIFPHDCSQTYPSTTRVASYQHLLELINDLHYGCQYNLSYMKAYKVKSNLRYLGKLRKTKSNRIRVAF
jgi:hypothetical protein